MKPWHHQESGCIQHPASSLLTPLIVLLPTPPYLLSPISGQQQTYFLSLSITWHFLDFTFMSHSVRTLFCLTSATPHDYSEIHLVYQHILYIAL